MSHKHRTPIREQIKYLVIFALIAVVGLSTYHVVNDLFADASAAISQERPQIQQKRVRYRFRRIYNGADVMTASHGGGISGPSLTTGSPYSSTISAVGASAPAKVGRRHTAAGGASWGVVTTVESQQLLRSYVSGGGSMGGGTSSGGSTGGGLGSGISTGGGYAVSLPALPSLRTNNSTTANLAALNGETTSEGGGRSKRGVKVFGDGWWEDTDTGQYGTVDGDGNVYDEGGNIIGKYDPYTGTFVSQGSVDSESQAPIGAPLLPLLLLVAGYIVTKRRKEESLASTD